MGTIYMTKVDEWLPPIADELGRKRFILMATVTVTDTTIVANNAYLNSPIFGNREVYVDRVSVMYNGTAGVLLESVLDTGLKPIAPIAIPLGVEITATADDEFFVYPLSPAVPLEPQALSLKTTSAVNFFVCTQAGATASDTMYVIFEGWFR